MGESTSTLATSLDSVVTSLTSAFSTSDLITIVTTCITAVAAYVILWFGVRYIIKRVKNGILKGKIGA